MTVEELKAKQRQLEKDIKDLVFDFNSDTGMWPESIQYSAKYGLLAGQKQLLQMTVHVPLA